MFHLSKLQLDYYSWIFFFHHQLYLMHSTFSISSTQCGFIHTVFVCPCFVYILPACMLFGFNLKKKCTNIIQFTSTNQCYKNRSNRPPGCWAAPSCSEITYMVKKIGPNAINWSKTTSQIQLKALNFGVWARI